MNHGNGLVFGGGAQMRVRNQNEMLVFNSINRKAAADKHVLMRRTYMYVSAVEGDALRAPS